MQLLDINAAAPTEVKEQAPTSSFPLVWLGFAFAFAFLVMEFAEVLFFPEDSLLLLLYAVAFGGWVYWLFCVHRLHRILEEMTSNRYPVSPTESVYKHFIPFYNFYFIYHWPSQLVRFLKQREAVSVVSGGVLGGLMLVSALMRYLDGAVGLACLFGVTLYLTGRLRRYVEEVKGSELPPPPDESFFLKKENETSAGPAVSEVTVQ